MRPARADLVTGRIAGFLQNSCWILNFPSRCNNIPCPRFSLRSLFSSRVDSKTEP